MAKPYPEVLLELARQGETDPRGSGDHHAVVGLGRGTHQLEHALEVASFDGKVDDVPRPNLLSTVGNHGLVSALDRRHQ